MSRAIPGNIGLCKCAHSSSKALRWLNLRLRTSRELTLMVLWDVVSLGFVLTAISGLVAVHAAPPLATRQNISTLTAAQVAAYRPYTHYASTAYCQPANTLAWNCGGEAVSSFRFTSYCLLF